MSHKAVQRAQGLDLLKADKISPQETANSPRSTASPLSIESTRQRMIGAGYWQARSGRTVRIHPMRERRARFGEMIHIDGSPHDGFEGRSDTCTLLVFIDDATGRLTPLRFMSTETTLGYLRVLHDRLLAHGVPVALYSDKHSIFRINAKAADPETETQCSRAARELGIACIHAHSPVAPGVLPPATFVPPCTSQAKGRVERANQTLQNRLVKAMRLAGIHDMDRANALAAGLPCGRQPTLCSAGKRRR